MQVIFSWDILEDMKRRFPNLFLFFSPQTKEDELQIVQQVIKDIQFTAYAFIDAVRPYPISGFRRPPANTDSSWQEMVSHEAITPEKLSFPLELIVSPGNESTNVGLGKAIALLRGPDRGTTGQNTIRVRYVELEYTFAFSLNDFYVTRTLAEQGALFPEPYRIGTNSIVGTFRSEITSAQLIVNGQIRVSAGGTFNEDGSFSYWVGNLNIRETDTLRLIAYDRNPSLAGARMIDSKQVTIMAQQSGQITPDMFNNLAQRVNELEKKG